MSYILERYRPTKISDILGNYTAIEKGLAWLQNFKNGTLAKNKKGLLIIGPPGVGKTSFAKILLESMGFEAMELNASNMRSKKVIKTMLDKVIYGNNIVSMMHQQPKDIGIIMDEVDGCITGDYGGIKEIVNYLKLDGKLESILKKKKKKKKVVVDNSKNGHNWNNILIPLRNPIICISNTDNKKILDIKRCSECIYFNHPSEFVLKQFISKICKIEKIEIPTYGIHIIYEKSQKDFRRILLMIDILISNFVGKKNITSKQIQAAVQLMDKKNIDITLNESIVEIFNNVSNTQKFDVTNIDKYIQCDVILIPLLLYENYFDYILNNLYGTPIDKCNKISTYLDSIFYYCFFENRLYFDKIWCMSNYMISTCCLGIQTTLNSFEKKIGKPINIQFTRVLSKNSVKFNYIRYNERLSKKVSIDMKHITYFSNVFFADVLKIEKDHQKENKKKEKAHKRAQEKATIKNSASTAIVEAEAEVEVKKKKKLSKRKSQEQKRKLIYDGSDLFEFIRKNDLEKKDMDKICKLSGNHKYWSENKIIREFIDSFD
jgi:DNA polymerase III delta prime subunit